MILKIRRHNKDICIVSTTYQTYTIRITIQKHIDKDNKPERREKTYIVNQRLTWTNRK